MELSVVIPVYNAEGFVDSSVGRLRDFLADRFSAYEVVVVDDGSSDGTAAAVERLTDDRVRLEVLPRNRGKFAALQTGMAEARGSCRVFTDADLPFDLEAIPYIADLVNRRQVHVVVGDRTLPESEHRIGLPPLRRWTTHGYSFFVRMLVTGGLFDTQCGIKGFRGDVAAALFPLLRDPGFSGDVEALYVALKYNLEIKRIPVRLRNNAPSTVKVGQHSVLMLARILGLRRSWKKGRYWSEELRRIADQRYWREGSP